VKERETPKAGEALAGTTEHATRMHTESTAQIEQRQSTLVTVRARTSGCYSI